MGRGSFLDRVMEKASFCGGDIWAENGKKQASQKAEGRTLQAEGVISTKARSWKRLGIVEATVAGVSERVRRCG